MRIVHVIGHCVPGLGYEENYLPKTEAMLGQDVVLITSTRIPNALRATLSKHSLLTGTSTDQSWTRESGLTVLRLPSVPEVYGQIVLIGLRKALKKLSPDVVHAHGAFSPNSLICAMLQRKRGYALFVDDHTSYDLKAKKGLKAAYVASVRQFYDKYSTAVSKFLPVTPAAANTLHVELRIPSARITLTSLGAYDGLFTPSAESSLRTRKQLDLSDREVLVICAGKFGTEKRLDLLIRALASLHSADNKTVRLLLAGSAKPDYIKQVRSLCRQLGVEGRVKFCDFLPRTELAAYYNAADVGVWPGAHTITVLEALATGLPCIVPASNEYAPLLRLGACLSFDPGNVESLASSLTKLLDDPSLRSETALKARQAVEEMFSWEAITKKTLALYSSSIRETL